jgi:hypothetical protein
MAKAFASAGDLTEKEISFTQIGEGLYAFTAQGDPNSGVIIGDDSVMIVEAQATPRDPWWSSAGRRIGTASSPASRASSKGTRKSPA